MKVGEKMNKPLTLRQARKASEITQKALAESLGVSRNTYLKIEQQPELATIKQAKTIAKILGVSYDEIFFGTNST